jgi:hypothetical protein
MFEDEEEFEGGMEFTSDFLSSLYCRIFLPGSEIVTKGERFAELYLIHKGTVTLSVDSVVTGDQGEFFILPTYSYFGDYQIIMNLRSQILYK